MTSSEAGTKSLREKIGTLKCKKIDPAWSFSDKAWNNAIDACLMVLTEHERAERGRDEELAELRKKVALYKMNGHLFSTKDDATEAVNMAESLRWFILREIDVALTAEGRAGEGEK